MLSQTAEYALRAVLHIAREGGKGPIRTEEVAEALDLPRNYLSKILHTLGRQGILVSLRGPHGGFKLANSAEEIMLEEVVRIFDPQLFEEESRCLLGRTVCSDRSPCAAHFRWKEVASTVRDFFRRTSIGEMATSSDPTLRGSA